MNAKDKTPQQTSGKGFAPVKFFSQVGEICRLRRKKQESFFQVCELSGLSRHSFCSTMTA